jgi:hypothetical protein
MIFVVDRNLVVDRSLYLLSDRARRNFLQDGHAATPLGTKIGGFAVPQRWRANFV